MALTRKDTQTEDGNNRGALAEALSDAQDRKARSNSLFREGKHKRAAEEYINALRVVSSFLSSPNPDITSLVVALRSNLAACYLEMEQYEQVVEEDKATVAIDPLHLKAYSRLCKAQYSLKLLSEAAETMTVVVALTLPRRLDDTMLPIFNELVGFHMLPPQISHFACVESDRELQRALLANKPFVVLKPGSYSRGLGSLQLDSSLMLIGLGKVDIMCGASGHSLHLISGQMQARRLNLVGEVRGAVCVGSEHAELSLFDCTVEDHKGQGVVVIGGHAILHKCTFRKLGKQAVEVRGGSAKVLDCQISKCRQGVTVSGGLKLLEIIECKIEDIAREGVLISGKIRSEGGNVHFGLDELRANLPGEHAARRGVETCVHIAGSTLLEVRIAHTVVKGCRSHGLLLDDIDANVSILNAELVDNAPAACYVKGGTTVILDRCQFEVDKNMSGLTVVINYDATVTASGNVFVVGDHKSAMIEEEVSAGGGSGMCKPIIDRNNKIIARQASSTSKSGLPSATEELDAQEEGQRSGRSALTQSQQALARTSRLVFNNMRNLPNFCGVGDTFGHDLSLGQKLSARKEGNEVADSPKIVRILLGACGEIRNILKTVFSLQQSSQPLVQVVLNDWKLAILAQDIVLLSLIAQRISAANVLAIWANHALTPIQREILNNVLVKLALSLPNWLVCSEESGNNLAAQLLQAFASWRDCAMTLQELDGLHAQSLTEDRKDIGVDSVRGAVGHIHAADKEIKHHISSGNIKRTKAMKSANTLLLEAPSLKYTLHWASSIFRAIKLEESDSSCSEGLYELLLRTISPQINAVAGSFEQGALHVGVIDGNVLDVMLYGGCLRLLYQLDGQSQHPSTDSPLFDFIDLSNTGDYLSMPAVVQAGLPLLKVEKHAVLHVESLTWWMKYDMKEPREFLKCAFGMHLDSYKELFGVLVQAQVVGSYRLPLLRTQWTWGLHANHEARVSGAMVPLEMMTAAKLHCSIDRANYISNDGIRLNSDEMLAGYNAGIENSSPLTMLHLLHLRCPDIALQIAGVLVAANEVCHPRRWELTKSHAIFQQNLAFAPHTFVTVSFEANVQYTTLLACPESPLCLMVSNALVRVGRAPNDVNTTTVVELLEAFSYSIENDQVEVMLPLELLEDPTCKSYYMTLCAVTNGTKLQALGSSTPWSNLATKPLLAPFPRWTPCKGMAEQALLSGDVEPLKLITTMLTSGNDDSPVQTWRTHAVLETSRFVIVELLLPRPLPGPDKVAISVTSSGPSLKVAAKAVTRTRQRGFVFPDQEHIMELPAAVSSRGHKTKLSRKLGIMIVHLPKVV